MKIGFVTQKPISIVILFFLFDIIHAGAINPNSGSNLKHSISFAANMEIPESSGYQAINIAPVLSNMEVASLAYTSGNGDVSITSSMTVTDADNVNLVSAIVKISSGYLSTEDLLSLPSPPAGITATWDGTTGTLTLNGLATLSGYQNALRAVKYKNTNTLNPSLLTRTVTFVVNDGTDNSNVLSRNITINQAPVLAGIESSTLAYYDGSAKVSVTSSITVSHPDNTNIQSATISITGSYTASEDVLSYVSANGITSSWDSNLGILTLTGPAGILNYQQALRDVKYENTNSINPNTANRVISFVVNDGLVNSNILTRTISIIHINLAPQLSNIESANLIYNEGAGKIAITANLSVSDPDNLTLSSASVRITGGYISPEDVLSFTNQNGISGSWNSTSGLLSLTGLSSVSNYQTALRSVKYENTNTVNPSTLSRTVSFMVNDGSASSSPVSRIIEVNAVNQPPVLSKIENPALSYTEGSGKIPVTATITVADADNANLQSAEITISGGYLNTEDILSFVPANGITAAWNSSSGKLTLTGPSSLSGFQTALRNIYYENTNSTNPSSAARTISFTVNDGNANSNIVSRNINMVLVNDPPVLADIENTILNYNEGDGKTAVTSSITAADADNTNLQSATIRISSGYINSEDVLSFVNANGITGSWNAASGTLSLTGSSSLSSYITALRSVQYENTNIVNPTASARVVSFTVNDGVVNSNTVVRNILVIRVNQLPVLSNIESSALQYNQGAGKVSITATLKVTDNDNTNLQSAIVKIAAGFITGEDVLSFVTANGISASWNAATGILSLTGQATLANYQTALRNVKYENTNSTNPGPAPRTVTFTVFDGAGNSLEVSRDLNVLHVNHAPVLANLESSTISYTEGSGKVNLSAAVTITDSDNTSLQSAEIKFSAGYIALEDVLSFTAANGITSYWNASTGSLTLTGTATVANYQTALRNVRYENINTNNPGTGNRTVTMTVNDGSSNSNAPSRGITIIAVNQAPALSNIENTPLSYTEGSGNQVITSQLSLSDVDNSNMQSATITISSGYTASEDVLSFTSQNGITSSWDSNGGILTLSGQASVSAYQSALRSITYLNSNINNPVIVIRGISFQVNDGTDNSNTISRNIDIIHINKPPVLAHMETSRLAYNTGSAKVIITNNTTVTDVDDTSLESATIKIVSGYDLSEDLLSFTNANGITGTWNGSTGTLELSGTATLSRYQTALRNVRYENTNHTNPSPIDRVVRFAVFDGESYSTNVQRTISINSVPMATLVNVTGMLSVCKTLTGNYTYADAESDAEGTTSFRWLRATGISAAKTAITGATSDTYTLTDADKGMYIFFEVTPRAKTGSINGLPTLSDPAGPIQNLLPQLTISGPQSICEGTAADLSFTFSGTPPFNLTYTDGNTNFNLSSQHYFNNVRITKGGTYKGLTLTDNLNCPVTSLPSALNVAEKSKPAVNIVGLNNIYSLRAAPVPLTGNPSGGIFSGEGVISVTNTFDPALAGVANSPHPIVYTYMDPGSSCSNADTVLVTIVDATASISGFRSQLKYCNLDQPFVITGSNIKGVTGSFTISGNIGITDHGDNTATIDPEKLQSGNYAVTYRYLDGVYQSVYQNFTVEKLEEATIFGFSQTYYCQNNAIIPIHGNYDSGIFEGKGIVKTGDSYIFNPATANTGIVPVKYTYITSYGCSVRDSISLTILPVTKTAFTIDNHCWKGDSTRFLNITAHPDSIIHWKWNFGDQSAEWISNSFTTIKRHAYQNSGDYTVKLISENNANCIDTVTRKIHLSDNPNVSFQWETECGTGEGTTHISNLSSGKDAFKSVIWSVTDTTNNEILVQTQDLDWNFNPYDTYAIKLLINNIYGCSDSLTKLLYLSPTQVLKDSIYQLDFENPAKLWHPEQAGTNNWKWDKPTGKEISSTHSGKYANYTYFTGPRMNQQLILASPCFDFTGLQRPYIEMWINSSNSTGKEGTVLQYKTENSANWITVGSLNSGINWYNSESIASAPGEQMNGWTGTTQGWVKTRNNLDSLANKKNVKLRMVYGSNQSADVHDGFAFDDLFIGERNRSALFEHFTNLSSDAGLQSNKIVRNLLQSAGNDVIGIEYHASFPGSDSLNLNNPTDPGARILYYGIGNIPLSILNGGSNASLIFDYENKTPSTNDLVNQSLQDTPFILDLQAEKTDNHLQGKVQITALNNLTDQKSSLYIAIVEDIDIQYELSTMTLTNVVKKLIPTAAGSPLQANWTKDEKFEVPFSWDYKHVFNPAKVKVVVYIQSESSKQVLQVAAIEPSYKTSVSAFIDSNNSKMEALVYPNPASDLVHLIFSRPLKENLSFQLINLKGQAVMTSQIQKQTSVYEFKTARLQDGLYYIRLNDNHGYFTSLKLLINN